MTEHGTAPAFRTGTPATARITCHDSPQKHLQVTPGDLHVNADLKESATWECPDGKSFTIVFTPETPFDDWVYNQSGAKNLSPRRDAAHKKPFKYLVAIEGYPPLDPNVVVDP